MTVKKSALGVAAICLIAACFTACSSGTAGSDPEVTTSQQQLGTVKAGDSAAALGVALWRTDGATGTIKGFNAAGTVIAAITVDAKAGVIRTSIPDVGARSINNPTESSLSPRATAFVDAAKLDLKASAENFDSVPVGGSSEVEKSYSTYACYQYYSDCSSFCLYQEYYGYWHACECDYPAAECPTSPWVWALRYN